MAGSSRLGGPETNETLVVSRLGRAHIFESLAVPVDPGPARITAWPRGSNGPDGPDRVITWPRGSNGQTFRSAAVLVPVVERPDGLTLLFTRRADHLKSHSGQISFPGGRMEPDDGSPEATALRETAEEIGLPAERVSLAGRLNIRETGSGYRVVPVVGVIEPPLSLVPDENEVAEIFEVPLDFLVEPANHRFETRVRGNVERQFYAVPYGRHFIWGLTARLVVDLSRALLRR